MRWLDGTAPGAGGAAGGGGIKSECLLLLLLLLLSRISRVRHCATPETAAHQAPRPWVSPGKNLEWVAISFSNA